MTITRIGITEPSGGIPIISKAVVHAGIVYLGGVTPDASGDIEEQTDQVLARVERLLAAAGSDKSKLLTAQVWLSDMRLFERHNARWNAWVDPSNPPVRACVEARLWQPGMLVEVMVTSSAHD